MAVEPQAYGQSACSKARLKPFPNFLEIRSIWAPKSASSPHCIPGAENWTFTPHLHCLVTAGGLAASEWLASSKKFLLPFGIVRAVFRGKYLYYLRKALARGELVLPEGMGPQQARKPVQ